ncbi:MAG: efflux RND transporter permease subunit [Trueperaceae bacterium]|nr:MAG: efflux RND transporter permease subunit [Trueperaceae bacterium]
MRTIVASSLTFRFIVVALAIMLMVFGFSRLGDMPVDVFPEFAPPLVEIQTPTLGLSAEEVETLVTIPLEEVLQGVPGLDVMRSKSVEQLSDIKMIFEPGTDLIEARQVVAERLALVTPTLPTWSSPPFMLQPLSATSRVMKIGLSSEEYSVIDLSMIAYWKIRERLLGVRGVAHVAIWGERLQMLQVQVEPERMVAAGVTLDDVLEATSDALDVGLVQYSEGTYVGTGGFIEADGQRLSIHLNSPVVTPEDLGEVALKVSDTGETLRLKDVAKLVEDHQPLIGDGVINHDVGLLLIVEKFPWGNTLEVTRGVEEAIDEMRPGLQGIDIDTEIFRPATFVELSMKNLTNALLLGGILVILVLIAFLYEWRVAMISLIAMPLSLMGAVLVLYMRGATINVMILAGLIIALGAVVDDAIIDVENITRRLRQHRRAGSNVSTARIILESSLEVRHAIVFATLIEVIALAPVFFMEGLSGSFFKPLAFSYVLAVLASLVVALTVTPAMCLILLRDTKLERRESPLIPFLQRGYNAVLKGILRTPVTSYVTFGVIALAGILIVPRLGQELLPDFKERDFLMHWLAKPGTSVTEMDRITIQAGKELLEIPGVRNFGAHIGQALLMDEVVGIYFGENWVSVDPKVDYDDTVNAIQTAVDGYPGLFRDVQTYLKERIREVLTGSSDAIVVRIFGPELPVLREKADEVFNALDRIPGIVDLHVELVTEIPNIDIKVDLERAQAFGLKPGDVRRATSTMIAGIEAGDIHTSNRTFDVQVWSTPEYRNSMTDLYNLPINIPGGGYVRLEEVANIDIVPTANTINRENINRRIDVEANVDGRDLGSVVADVERALDSVEFPLEYHPVLLGEFAELQASQRRLQGMAIAAVIAIFILLQTVFGSWRLAALSGLTLPAALVGGVLAAYFTSGILSLGSLVGFLTVLGIAARNGIMMITHFEHLERYEGETFGPQLVLRGAKERLAPILMTALTTGLALVPLVLAGSIAGHEIEHPMAVVILGGLVTSTLVNLFIIPPLYLRFGKGRNLAEKPLGV